MKVQTYKPTQEVVARLEDALSFTTREIFLVRSNTRIVSENGPFRYEVAGTGMDFNAVTSTWNTSGTVTEAQYFWSGELILHISGASVPFSRGANVGLTFAMLGDTSGADEFVGSNFSDDFFMGIGNDILRTGLGDDSLRTEGGNDLLDGGLGLDTVITSGARASYSLVLDPTRLGGTLRDLRTGSPDGTDTLAGIEYIQFTDSRLSLPEFGLGTIRPPDRTGTQVYRFAKLDNGQYFYSGSRDERDLIVATMPNFRYEGPVYNAQDNWITGYDPVYRFANLNNGGYFYTASASERDLVFSSYPHFRYEGATFFVPHTASAETVPVYRLANTSTGGYLFTTSSAERSFAVSLGVWRDEGVAFPAPRTMALAFETTALAGDDSDLASAFTNDALVTALPLGEVWSLG